MEKKAPPSAQPATTCRPPQASVCPRVGWETVLGKMQKGFYARYQLCIYFNIWGGEMQLACKTVTFMASLALGKAQIKEKI